VVQLKSFTLGVLLAPEFVEILDWIDSNRSDKQLEKDCPELINTENKFTNSPRHHQLITILLIQRMT
jgi:hypothetical protein